MSPGGGEEEDRMVVMIVFVGISVAVDYGCMRVSGMDGESELVSISQHLTVPPSVGDCQHIFYRCFVHYLPNLSAPALPVSPLLPDLSNNFLFLSALYIYEFIHVTLTNDKNTHFVHFLPVLPPRRSILGRLPLRTST